jgi:filamentous hemagglutinin
MAQGGRKVHGKVLPNYQRAVIPRKKVEAYVLDPSHPDGKHKAIVFKSALGFEQSDWAILRDSISAELPYHEASIGKNDQYGARYNVIMPITGPNGRTVDVLTAWIVEHGTNYPSFVTARVM